MSSTRQLNILKALEVRFEKGQILFWEGEHTRDVFILLSGCVEIRKNKKIIGRVDTPDTYLGEMSTLLGSPRTATLIAATDCQLIQVPEDKVLEFFQHSPKLGIKLARTLAFRLREMNSKYERMLNDSEFVEKNAFK